MEKETIKNQIEPFVLRPSAQEQQIVDIVEPIIMGQGYDLVRLRITGQKAHAKVALYIDVRDSEGLISIDQLEFLNRLVGDALDVADAEQKLFSGSYELEVSSPGLDRPLSKVSHFTKALGKLIRLKTDAHAQRPKTVTGLLLDVDDKRVIIESPEGEPVHIPWDSVRDAHVVYVFPDKKTGKNVKKGSLKRR